MSSSRAFDVYLSPSKPIPASTPGWDPEQTATWPATTATLVRSGDQAVLVDALMTTREGETLAAWVGERTTTLNAVYVTHGHADHFFGASTLLPRFPASRLVATPQVAEDAAQQAQPGYLAIWETFFPGEVAATPTVPQPLTTDLELPGLVLRPVEVGASDVPHSTVLHVPELELVVCGDVAYNGIHMWMAGSDQRSRKAWLTSLDAVEELRAGTIIAGHRDPSAPDDDASRLLDESRQYVHDFDVAAREAGSAPDLVAKVMSRHGDLGNPYTLWVAAASQFEDHPDSGSE